MSTNASKRGRKVYKVAFISQGKVYEVYARKVGQGELYGFIQIEELLFGERSSVVVDPSEERLRGEFAGVSRCHVPIHAVIRIDEVEKEGAAKIRAAGEGDNVAAFPHPLIPPGKPS